MDIYTVLKFHINWCKPFRVIARKLFCDGRDGRTDGKDGKADYYRAPADTRRKT